MLLPPGFAGAAPFAYISNSASNSVSVIDTANNTVVATAPVGTNPWGVAVNPSGTRAYVSNRDSNSVSVIATASNSVVATIPIGSSPGGVAMNPAGTRAYVAKFGSASVSVIDTASNSVVATVPVGTNPWGMAMSPTGTRAYVVNLSSDSVSVIDTASNSVVATVPVGTNPWGVAVNPTGTRAYVTNANSNTVSVIDTASNSLVATVPVGNNPAGVTVNPAGSRVYVANAVSNTVSVIDTASNSVVVTVAVGSNPHGVAVNPSGSRAYVANAISNTVSVIDTASNAVVATVAVGNAPIAFGQFIVPSQTIRFDPLVNRSYGEPPFSLSSSATSGLPVTFTSSTLSVCTVNGNTVTLVAAGSCTLAANQSGDANFPAAPQVMQTFTVANPKRYAYISNAASNTVSVIDTASNSVVATVPVGTYPRGVAVNPVGTRAYVANHGSTSVSVIATASNNVVATVDVGSSPGGVVVNPAGTRVYVAKYGSTSVSVIDTASNSVVATVPVGSNPWGVAMNLAGTRVYVANSQSNTVSVIDTASNSVMATVPVGSNPWGMAVNPSGTRVYASNHLSNLVSVIDTASNSMVATILVGTAPSGVTVNPVGSRAYVANYGSNSVSVIDTASNSVAVTVNVGSYPHGVAVNPAGTRAYVTNSGSNNVSVIDTASNTVIATVAVGSAPSAFGQFMVPSQTIRFDALANRSYGDPAFSLSASASSGLPVAFTSSTPLVCTVNGNTVTLAAAGSCVLTAAQPGDEVFAPALPVTQSFNVAKANQTITFGTAPIISFGGTGPVSATSTSGLAVSFTSSGVCTINGNTVTGVTAGSCTIAANQVGDTNYNPAQQVTQTFTIAKLNQTLTFGSAPSVIVGGTGAVSATGGLSGNLVTFTSTTQGVCTVSGNTVSGVAAGSCSIAANQAGNDNYAAAAPVSQQFNVAGFVLTLVNGNPAGGSITSEPGGIACGPTCTASFAPGATVKLTAIPVAGYQFSGWGGSCSGYGNVCTVTLDAAKSVTANFAGFNTRRKPAWRRWLMSQ